MSKFAQEIEPVAVPKHVKDDLNAPLEANVHSQFRLQLQKKPTPVVCHWNPAKQVCDSHWS